MSRRAASRGAGLQTRDEIEEKFRTRYVSYQYIFVEFFCTHLADLYRVFDGDLEEMLVLSLVGQIYLNFQIEQKGEGRQARVPPAPKITASRISDVSGVPRETVRRKLAKLKQRGWVEQHADGAWFIVSREGSSAARRDLVDLDSRTIARIAGLHSKLAALLDD